MVKFIFQIKYFAIKNNNNLALENFWIKSNNLINKGLIYMYIIIFLQVNMLLAWIAL